MHVAVIGPLEVRRDDLAPVLVPGARERLLLALLVAQSPSAVGVEHLAEALWDGVPPDDVPGAVRAAVVGLRAALEPGLPANVSGRYVLRRGRGYALALPRGEIDAERFVVLTARAQQRLDAGDTAEAARLVTTALGLWRGEPYADWSGVARFEDERHRLRAAREMAEAVVVEARSRPATVPAAVPAAAQAAAGSPFRHVPPPGPPPGLAPAPVPTPARAVLVPAPRAEIPVRNPAPVRRADPDTLVPDPLAAVQPRRLRLLVLALVATLVAVVLAVRSQQTVPRPSAGTEEASPRDDAERLIDLSVTDGPLDISLLLAVEAVRLDESAKTRNALRAVLMAHPRAERVGRIPGTPQGVALSATGSLVVVTHLDVVSWQIDEREPPRALMPIPPEWGIWAAALPSPTDDVVVGVGQNDEVPWVRMISAADGGSRLLLVGDGAGGLPLDGALSPDGRRAVLLVVDPVGVAPRITTEWRVVELDVGDGSVHGTGISGVFPAPVGALGVDFASDAGSFVVWDRTSDSVTRVDLADGRSAAVQVAPNRNGTVRWRALPGGAARLGADGEIVLVGRDGATVQVLHEHAGPVMDVEVAPDGSWAASAGDGLPVGELYRWDVDPATGRWSEPEVLAGHRGAVVDVGITDGGARLVSTSGDTTSISWRMGADAGRAASLRTMDPAGLVAIACAIVGRDFTAVEWERYLGDRPFEPTCSEARPPDA